MPRAEDARFVCRNNPSNCVSGEVDGVEWWRGRCCNKDCAYVIARIQHAFVEKDEPYPDGFTMPPWRDHAKGEAVTDAYSEEKMRERAEAGAAKKRKRAEEAASAPAMSKKAKGKQRMPPEASPSSVNTEPLLPSDAEDE
jgi:hypothetical protein